MGKRKRIRDRATGAKIGRPELPYASDPDRYPIAIADAVMTAWHLSERRAFDPLELLRAPSNGMVSALPAGAQCHCDPWSPMSRNVIAPSAIRPL